MANEKKVVTGLGKPEIHRVLIRGYDLTKDLVGKITFADMTYLMLVGRFPNDGERRMTDALLTILVEHGMVSSVVSARLCYSTAPEALQAAVASSILGAGASILALGMVGKNARQGVFRRAVRRVISMQPRRRW
jgi:citrate synthase